MRELADVVRRYDPGSPLLSRVEAMLDDSGMADKPARKTLVERVDSIIAENISQPEFNVDVIVDKLLMSRSTLYARFAEETGKSLGNYLRDKRIEKAKALLANPNLHISDVSDAVGFYNQRYFSTFFKSHTGCTPSEWRERLR